MLILSFGLLVLSAADELGQASIFKGISMDQHTDPASIDPDPLEVIVMCAVAVPLDLAEPFLRGGRSGVALRIS